MTIRINSTIASLVPLAALVVLLDRPATAQDGAPSRPNIVLFLADDMAWDDSGAYGHPTIKTPNIDALAREGLRFDRAFLTCSSCSPSRSSLITGRYPHATGAEELHWPLPADQVTFVERLKESGYYTAAAGKWHLGDAVKGRFDEIREADPRGFQLPSGDDAEGEPRRSGTLGFDAAGAVQAGCDQWVPVLRDRPRDRPFFLWLAALDPHRDYREGTIPEPHSPEAMVVPPYLPDTPEVRRDLALYCDEISRLDHHVGQVLDELDRQGVADETLVLFLSDNGRPFPRCKTTVYDSGIRTPLIARWPGRIAPGGESGALLSAVDLAPTLLSIAGLEAGPTFQGRDASALFDDPSASIREFAFAEHNWHDYAARKRAVRSDRYKYIRNDDATMPLTPPADAVRSPTFAELKRLRDEGGLGPDQDACFALPRPAEELYDLDADPHELTNLADDPRHAEVLDAMQAALDSWSAETVDAPPVALSGDEFDRESGKPFPNRRRPRLPRPDLTGSAGR
ncbi:sulfatase family protein [Tautonia plasticadhaerens]|uniref:Arylsulfatase n=1 Tax=Tautonia plasticadhaerens TaxID=2527974 RepID=A0A518H9G6_9BACT|nr:sulfatase [Tautonia plasticadhaerens]QDV37502.1 Arylsulfatase [Tautonia plasticadhaerens]